MRKLKIQVMEFPPPLQKQIYLPKLVKTRKERRRKKKKKKNLDVSALRPFQQQVDFFCGAGI